MYMLYTLDTCKYISKNPLTPGKGACLGEIIIFSSCDVGAVYIHGMSIGLNWNFLGVLEEATLLRASRL